MPTTEKIAKIEELTKILAGAKAIYLADFTGIDVTSVTELRQKLRAASVEYQVVKNRLAKRAAEAAGIGQLGAHLTGPTAIACANEDPLAAAKIMQDFIDAGGKLTIKSGIFEGRLLSEEQVKELAKLPSKEQLLGQVVGGIQAPLFSLVWVISGLLRNLVGVIAAIEKELSKDFPESET